MQKSKQGYIDVNIIINKNCWKPLKPSLSGIAMRGLCGGLKFKWYSSSGMFVPKKRREKWLKDLITYV